MIESVDASRSSTVPLTTMLPPCSPASGPMSTTQSAVRMVSSSCSTTISVLPRFLQPDQRLDQPVVVALVQPDRRLVEDVEHADQPGADLGGEPDALRLAAGQRGGGAVEREVVQADVDEEAEPGVDLLQHPLADHRVAVVEVAARCSQLGGVADRQRGDLGDRAPVDRDGEDLGLEPGALAGRARHLAHEALVLLARVVALGLGVAALDPRHHALVVGVVRSGRGRSGCGS